MKNRTFRSDRLYKLASFVVILLTLYYSFNAIYAYTRLENVKKYPSECNKDYWKSDYAECLVLMHGTVDNVAEEVGTNTFIAILLPASFFGGTLLYKFIFPAKKK